MSSDRKTPDLHPIRGKARIAAALPGWSIKRRGIDFMYVAKSPDYIPGLGGIVIEGKTPERVIAQVNRLLAFWEPEVLDDDVDVHHRISFGINSDINSEPARLGGSSLGLPVPVNYTGSRCPNSECRSMKMVSTGTGESCLDCHTLSERL